VEKPHLHFAKEFESLVGQSLSERQGLPLLVEVKGLPQVPFSGLAQ
jgi:hypothetical protein